jgi:hypothetical protein
MGWSECGGSLAIEWLAMRRADIKRGRTFINWPDTATRTVTTIRDEIDHFKEVRLDWRPPRDRCRFDRFAGWAKREVDHPLPERRSSVCRSE